MDTMVGDGSCLSMGDWCWIDLGMYCQMMHRTISPLLSLLTLRIRSCDTSNSRSTLTLAVNHLPILFIIIYYILIIIHYLPFILDCGPDVWVSPSLSSGRSSSAWFLCSTSPTPSRRPTWTRQSCSANGGTAKAKTRSTRRSSGNAPGLRPHPSHSRNHHALRHCPTGSRCCRRRRRRIATESRCRPLWRSTASRPGFPPRTAAQTSSTTTSTTTTWSRRTRTTTTASWSLSVRPAASAAWRTVGCPPGVTMTRTTLATRNHDGRLLAAKKLPVFLFCVSVCVCVRAHVCLHIQSDQRSTANKKVPSFIKHIWFEAVHGVFKCCRNLEYPPFALIAACTQTCFRCLTGNTNWAPVFPFRGSGVGFTLWLVAVCSTAAAAFSF